MEKNCTNCKWYWSGKCNKSDDNFEATYELHSDVYKINKQLNDKVNEVIKSDIINDYINSRFDINRLSYIFINLINKDAIKKTFKGEIIRKVTLEDEQKIKDKLKEIIIDTIKSQIIDNNLSKDYDYDLEYIEVPVSINNPYNFYCSNWE